MGLVLPELDGLETTRRLRANENTRGDDHRGDGPCVGDRPRGGHRAGCNFFLLKPYDLPTLANFVDGLMRPSAPQPQTAGRLPLNFATQSR
jgi:CheY-like chemotaxis protein